MNIKVSENNLILYDVSDFKLSHTLDCGQCFRWEKEDDPEFDETYTGVAFGKVLKISQKKNTVILFDTSLQDFQDIWQKYFDFSRDYTEIKRVLSCDEILKKSIAFGEGIRILNQDVWECIVSFIISASNNIPRIKKIISSLCENFGNKIEYENKTYYSFPDAETVAALSLEDISVIKCGFRDKYILDAAQKVVSGEIDTDALRLMDRTSAKKALCSIKGVGNKVSDCILLFSLEKYDSFPIDVWIKRVMEYYYFSGADTAVDKIEKLASEKFSPFGGFAQQYLFFYARNKDPNI